MEKERLVLIKISEHNNYSDNVIDNLCYMCFKSTIYCTRLLH